MKVLVVDDDPVSLRIISRKIRSWGYECTSALDTHEAEEILSETNCRFLIVGIGFPNGAGINLIKIARHMDRPRYLFIMATTGSEDHGRMLEALEAGADDLMRKPIDLTQFHLRFKAAKRTLNIEDELREGAGLDSSTGVINADSLHHFFQTVVAENRRTESTGSLMLVRIENYFDVRETYGYRLGETMMMHAAHRLADSVRGADMVARLSDDTFCICLQNTQWPKCRIVGEKILNKLSLIELIYEDLVLNAEAKIEVINFPYGDVAPQEILSSAPRYSLDSSSEHRNKNH